MGLYLSAHPLDKYDTYFAENTHPFGLITQANDNKIVTIGGIISSVRNILTKSNTHMAFVKVENKTSDVEVIVFPNLYEKIGGKLNQDVVIKVTGRVNATDRDGRPASEVKLIAEDISIISDDELENYQPTGEKLPAPASAPQRKTYSKNNYHSSASRVSSTDIPTPPPKPISPPEDHRHERLWILIENPNDANVLNKIRHLCEQHSGIQEIILVLQEKDEKRPLRLPFRVNFEAEFISSLKELLGEEKVKIS